MQEVINEGRYDKDNHQLIKDLKRDMVEDIVKYEDILTYLDGVYAAKAEKYAVEIAEMTKNFEVIAQRRSIMRGKIKEAVAATEDERNKYDQLRSREDRTLTGSQRRGGGGEKQFKQPQGSHPDRISSEYTPLMAQNWAADMMLYIKTCSNLEILSTAEEIRLAGPVAAGGAQQT